MRITIEIDTNEDLSLPDIRLVQAILGQSEFSVGSPEPQKAPPSASETDPATDSPQQVSEALLEEAIERARELLEAKQTAKVKKALAAAGVERVSHLATDEQVNTFLGAL